MNLETLLYAPNIHTGGGLVLLNGILNSWDQEKTLFAFLDIRIRGRVKLPPLCEIIWVKPNLFSRLVAEIKLCWESFSFNKILCFHGMPPLLPSFAPVVVFQQNRNYLNLNPVNNFPFKVRLRLKTERFISRSFRKRVSTYVVQTPSMSRDLKQWYGNGAGAIKILEFPFFDLTLCNNVKSDVLKWDFIYVSDGAAHKNHRILLDAWKLLASEGIRPTLALTLTDRDSELLREILRVAARHGMKIENLGYLSHDEILKSYHQIRALVFPSTSESFGLPLIEAQAIGVPIIASELDFIRDVCIPTETFDPNSALSLARAIKRFLDIKDTSIQLRTSKEFIKFIFSPMETVR